MATAAEAGPTTGKPACAVTFGRSTLLGRHLAAALAASGRWSAVVVLEPSPYPSPPPASPLVRHHAVDLSDPAGLASALAGAAAVFHVDGTTATAAAPGSDGSFLSLHRLAAEGTRRLLKACRAAGVGRVVYTGSADVVAAGARDVVNADEDSASYPDKFGNAVSELRAQVEMMVLGADGVDGMRTCVLRPSNMFGPGDSSLLRFVAGYARSPLGKFVIGGGSNMSDFTYVENVAHANICAEQALCSNATSVAGKPFFVTNDEPMETWEFMNCIMEAMGCPRPRINLPTKMLLSVALFSNMIRNRLGFQMFSTPLLHPDTIYFLSCTRTFNTSKARKLLGYYPIVSLEDGIMRTVGSFSELSDNLGFLRKQRSCGSSKADKLLGSGTGDTDPFSLEKIALWCFCFPPNWMNKNLVTKISCCSCAELFSFLLKYQTLHCDLYMFPLLTCYVSTAAADILLWRDEKRTFSFVIVLFLLFYWFLLSDRTFVSSAAKFLLVTSLTLFIHGVLPSQVFGFTVEKVTSDHFEVSHSALRNSLMCLASAWNGSIQKLRVLAEGEDWSTLLKVFAFLYSVKLLLNFQFRVLMGLVLASLFIVFIVYEQCEEEIDSLVSYASVKIKWLMDRVVELLPTSVKAYIS